jgi:hypothetical protein
MSAHLEPLLRDVAAQLAELGELSLTERLAHATALIAAETTIPIERVEVICGVFSRSAIYHLGGATVPATDGEAQQFREQARGGFVQLGTNEHPHVVLRIGPFVLDATHSASWRDRGVWLRPFIARPTFPAWTCDRLPFGVEVAYELVRDQDSIAVAA